MPFGGCDFAAPHWNALQVGGTKIRNNPERSGTSKPHMISIYNEIIHFYKKQLNKCRCNCALCHKTILPFHVVIFGLPHNVFDMKIPICLRSGTFRRTLRIAVSSLGPNPRRGFDVSQYQKYHISSIWCICNHAWITHDIHVQYYVEICMFSTLFNWLNWHVLFATTDVTQRASLWQRIGAIQYS